MIILDERNFLKKELEAHGFGVFDFFDVPHVVSMKEFSQFELKRRADFILVDTETVLRHPKLQEQFKTVLNTFMGAVFFHDHGNAKAQEWVNNEGGFLTKIIGEYALPMAPLSWTILSNQLQFLWSLLEDQRKLQMHIVQFSSELDQMLQNAESEMHRAKKIYDAFVPRKSEEIKGIFFANKYSVGDGGGVEFYDLIQSQGRIYHVLLSTQSYLISSAVLGILSQHREKNFNPQLFLQEVKAEIETINSSKKKKSEADILLLEVDPAEATLRSLTSSKAELHSRLSGPIALARDSSYQMVKGEKVVVLSPGFLFNWSETLKGSRVGEFIANQKQLPSHELMSELFFQLKDGKEDKFLKKDATVFMMEVQRHGIHKV